MTYKTPSSKIYIDVAYIKEIMSLPKETQGKWWSDMYRIISYKVLMKSILTAIKGTPDKKFISYVKNWIRINKKYSISN